MAGEQQAIGTWLVEQWSTRFGQVIESMTGESGKLTVKEAPHPEGTGPFWWEQGFSLASKATVWIASNAAEAIGSRILRSAGVEDGSAEDAKSTYQEVLNQSLSSLSQAMTSRLRKEVSCSSGKESAPDRETHLTYSVSFALPDIEVSLFVVLSDALMAALEEKEAPKSLESKPAKQAKLELPSALLETRSSKSLDLLLDVELPISVSFGRTQLPLKDVIKLTTGSIVELNRSVSEPVEIIVNNCVIAKGQVVVVEGNFGVRIEQVISRQERLRTVN